MTDREKKPITTRVTPALYELIQRECDKQNISIQTFIIQLLKEWVRGATEPSGKKQ